MTTTAPMRLRLSTPAQMRLKLALPTIKMRSLVTYPASLFAGTGIRIDAQNGSYTFNMDISKFNELTNIDPTKKLIAIFDPVFGWNTILLSDLINNFASVVQIVTGAGDVAVGTNTQLLVMNRAADINPSNIILPLSSTKVGKVKIVDFKGNASAFPHTVKTMAPDTFQGALTQWGLDGDGSSITADPITGVGYAI